MTILTFSENCKNSMARKNAGYSNGIYWLDGKSYTKKEFDLAFPLGDELINANELKKFKGENPDKRHNYKKNGKSY